MKIYQGNPNILVGVSLSRHEPVTVIVFDKQKKQVLECLTTKALLKIKGIQSPRKNRSIVKLQREHCQLLRRWRKKRKHDSHRRSGEQRHDNYQSQNSESRLGEYLDRLIASSILSRK